MIPTPSETQLRRKVTHRLVASRYPSIGILDRVSDAADLDAVFELEGWTNDRITSELGILHRLPPAEWLVGAPMASVVMAAFCHPRAAAGGSATRCGARGMRRSRWKRRTPRSRTPRTRAGGGGRDGRAHGDAAVRCRGERRVSRYPDGAARSTAPLYDPDTYATSQRFALDLLARRIERRRIPLRAPGRRHVPRLFPPASPRARAGRRPFRYPMARQRRSCHSPPETRNLTAVAPHPDPTAQQSENGAVAPLPGAVCGIRLGY